MLAELGKADPDRDSAAVIMPVLHLLEALAELIRRIAAQVAWMVQSNARLVTLDVHGNASLFAHDSRWPGRGQRVAVVVGPHRPEDAAPLIDSEVVDLHRGDMSAWRANEIRALT